MQRNRLAAETSPYLLQHADNPWIGIPGASKLCSRPSRKTSPSLVHRLFRLPLVHVMAHESFEDPATAP